ncbi:hypothetical protein ACFQ0T_03915 [Kitasatospora gansuensis]
MRNVACRVRTQDPSPAYEFAIAPRTPWSTEETTRFAALLDEGLRAESADYRAARSGPGPRLGDPTVLRLDPDAFLRDWQHTVGTGIRPTQVKDRLFRQDPEQWNRLTGRPAAEGKPA